MDLYAVAEAIEATPFSQAIRDSLYIFPIVEAAHLLALALLGGAALMLDLRLLGLGLRSQPPSVLERNARPWIKMSALAAAILFTFLVRNPLARRNPPVGVLTGLVALISLGLWLTTAIAGRWIGFS